MQNHTSNSLPYIFLICLYMSDLRSFLLYTLCTHLLFLMNFIYLIVLFYRWVSVSQGTTADPHRGPPHIASYSYHHNPHILIQYMPICISQDGSLLTHEAGVIRMFSVLVALDQINELHVRVTLTIWIPFLLGDYYHRPQAIKYKKSKQTAKKIEM